MSLRYTVTDYRGSHHLMTHHPFLDSYVSHRMSCYLFPLPIADCKRYLPRQLGNSYKSSSASPSTFATYLMYIVHLISIDLELSRSFNSSPLQSLHLPTSR